MLPLRVKKNTVRIKGKNLTRKEIKIMDSINSNNKHIFLKSEGMWWAYNPTFLWREVKEIYNHGSYCFGDKNLTTHLHGTLYIAKDVYSAFLRRKMFII